MKRNMYTHPWLMILVLAFAAASVTTPASAITYVGDVGSVSSNAAGTTLPIPVGAGGVAAGNTIVVGFASRGATSYNVPVVTDSKTNIYTLATNAITYGHGRSYIYFAHVNNALVNGNKITITTSSVSNRVAVASVFSGLLDINPLDKTLANPTGTTTTTNGNNPTVGPTAMTVQTNELIIGVIGTEEATNAGVGTWQNGFTAGPQIKSTGTSTYEWRVSLGYKIVSATGQFTAAKVVTNNPYWAASIATFKAGTSTPTMPSYNILLGRPTDVSVTVNTILDQGGQVYFEYGTVSGIYTNQTGTLTATAGEPVEVIINGLQTDTRYYYRMAYSDDGGVNWVKGDEYSFHTQRAKNETFTFTITSDSHLGQTVSDNTPQRYERATLNIAADNPDFNLDLGDAFIMDNTTNQTSANDIYLAQRPYFGNYSHSAAVFLTPGNHEDEEGWNLDDTPFSKALASIKAQKHYFLNPTPDGFYSGDTNLLPAIGGDQLREDYYAWEWGDALFVVLDPFQYTMTRPYGTVAGSGEDNDETVSGDQWNWTLGQDQYNWFKRTLENSNAKYKFVFAHHVVGGEITVSNPQAGPPTYVRGGAMAASYFEWGGNNTNGTWGFNTNRPGWQTPIHQLMISNGVTAFFHGHDHQFVYEKRDGIVYQLVPTPGMTGSGFDLYDNSPYVQTNPPYGLGNLPNAGHLRVTVSPDETKVEYVRSAISGDTGVTNRAVSYSYSCTNNMLSPVAPTLSAGPMLLPNGHFYAGFTGIPNVSYTVKYADEITGPWQTLTNITSNGSGLIQIDVIPAAAPAMRFYRVVYP